MRIFVLLFLDGDRFKSINDNWGHAAGDEVLKAIAARLSALAYQDDLVARLGGDEFAMLITSRTSERRSAAADGRYSYRNRAIDCDFGRHADHHIGDHRLRLVAAWRFGGVDSGARRYAHV